MATAAYVGNTAFRTVRTEEFENSEGVDTLTVVREGAASGMDTESALWTRGKVGTSLGYPNMYLQSKRVSQGKSALGQITLNFAGYLTSSLANPISIEDSTPLQSGTFTTDETDADGREQNVQAQFYAQSTTTRWIHRGPTAPTAPRYKAIVPTEVPTNTLFAHYPASYTGTLQTKVEGRLVDFNRVELATGVWGVTETWMIRIENDSS